ncbi:MAG: pilus assembly protein TadG-related protein, partial [Pseudomonadota bacterium]
MPPITNTFRKQERILMFFSWYAKNKHFKKGNNPAGQIIPFLLVILVILLSAAIATIKIGNVAVRKTCSANGADAGSLAAASVLAAGLNNLALTNRLVAENFEYAQAQLEAFKKTASDRLNEADALIAEARDQLMYANLAILAGAANHAPCTPWVQYGFFTAFLVIAEGKIKAAEDKIKDYIVVVTVMKELVDRLKDIQLQNYCIMKTYMDNTLVEAEKIGLQFARNNNCGAEVASASIILPSISYKVDHTLRNYPQSLKVDIPGAIGNLINKIFGPVVDVVNKVVEAIRKIPIVKWIEDAIKIFFSWLKDSFIVHWINEGLSHQNIPGTVDNFVKGIIAMLTISDDPFGIKTANFYQGVLHGFYLAFWGPIVAAGVLVTASTVGTAACLGVVTLPIGLGDFTALYAGLLWPFYLGYLPLWAGFNIFIDNPIDDLSIKRLKEHLEEIAQVWDNQNPQYYTSSSCNDVRNDISFGGGDSADPMAKGLMIYDIDNIISNWVVTCQVS